MTLENNTADPQNFYSRQLYKPVSGFAPFFLFLYARNIPCTMYENTIYISLLFFCQPIFIDITFRDIKSPHKVHSTSIQTYNINPKKEQSPTMAQVNPRHRRKQHIPTTCSKHEDESPRVGKSPPPSPNCMSSPETRQTTRT